MRFLAVRWADGWPVLAAVAVAVVKMGWFWRGSHWTSSLGVAGDGARGCCSSFSGTSKLYLMLSFPSAVSLHSGGRYKPNDKQWNDVVLVHLYFSLANYETTAFVAGWDSRLALGPFWFCDLSGWGCMLKLRFRPSWVYWARPFHGLALARSKPTKLSGFFKAILESSINYNRNVTII